MLICGQFTRASERNARPNETAGRCEAPIITMPNRFPCPREPMHERSIKAIRDP
jgi:hypothetical protein